MKKETLVFIGAGASNIFAISYLIHLGIDNNFNITVIDKGNSPENRTKDELLEGFGGAGTFSDFKCIFDQNLDIFKDFKNNEVENYHKILKEIIYKYHPNPSDITITHPEDFSEILKGTNLQIRQSECLHVGSKYAKELLINMYNDMVNRGIQFKFNSQLTEINIKSKVAHYENKDNGWTYYTGIFYDKLFLGLGKTGKKFVDNFLQESNIKQNKNEAHIGVRFECEYNKYIQEISKLQYDFKFYKGYNNMSIRTFCVNHYSAYVAEEHPNNEFKEGKRVQYNGHAYGLHCKEKYNGLTNFGIIGTVKCNNADDYIKNTLEKMDYKGYYISADNNFTKSIDNVESKFYFNDFISHFGKLGENIGDFIFELDKILHFNGKYRMYVPEIKISCGQVKSNDMSIDGIDDIYFIGDSGVKGTRGIIPAGVTGLKAISDIL